MTDTTTRRLWGGPAAAALLLTGLLGIAWATPGYSHARQTVSELGMVGAPGRVAFAALLLAVAVCLMACARGGARALGLLGSGAWPAHFILAFAVSVMGVGLFAHPHPLHNVFGLSELIGYQAPLVAALTARHVPALHAARRFSAVMYGLVLLAIAANLSSLFGNEALWARVEPIYGVVQRALFVAWFGWCAGYALLLRAATTRRA